MNTSTAIHPAELAEPTEFNPQSLVLVISSLIFVAAVGGWFLLGRPMSQSDTDALPETPADLEQAPVTTVPASNADLELRKARLAAEAGYILVPPERSALHFYTRVVAVDPTNSVAAAELNALLDRISGTINEHLAAREFDAAYPLAMSVAAYQPNHALVTETRAALNAYADELVAQAVLSADNGNDEEAAELIARVTALPGANGDYVAAARSLVTAASQTRVDAENGRIEAERVAAELEEAEWAASVRDAIVVGSLITPEEDNARDYLLTRTAPSEVKQQLTDEFLTALLSAGETSIDADDYESAATFLDAAAAFDDINDDHAETRERLESSLITAEGMKVLGLADLVRIKTEPAQYPRRAYELNLTGWVDVLFTVTTDGSTASIDVVASEPPALFVDSAVTAVSQWTFEPRQYRGKTIDQRTQARLVFQLE